MDGKTSIHRAETRDALKIALLLNQAFARDHHLFFGSRMTEGCRALAEVYALEIKTGHWGAFVAEREGEIIGVIALKTRETPFPPLWPTGRAFLRHLELGGALRALFLRLLIPLQVRPQEEDCYINFLAIHPHCQGKGIGKALLQPGEAYARAKGKRHLTLFVRLNNHRARGFYQSYGFQEEHAQKSRVASWLLGAPAWIFMRKSLSQ